MIGSTVEGTSIAKIDSRQSCSRFGRPRVQIKMAIDVVLAVEESLRAAGSAAVCRRSSFVCLLPVFAIFSVPVKAKARVPEQHKNAPQRHRKKMI
jgi:hypothetical protein